jgi:putative restriction endonuclease
MARLFGAVPGVPPGATFATRQAAAAAGVHKPLQAGISGSAQEGADSVVVSGGYEDDQDYGSVILYTGHGGLDPITGKQIADQTLTRQNLALAVSCIQGLPVRVLRGATGDPQYSPSSGYSYDGLFDVQSYWQATGRSGYKICRFVLVAQLAQNTTTNPPPAPPPGPGGVAFVSAQRTVRNTAVTQWVKALYGCACQVCGTKLQTAAGPYAEGAHLRPMGNPHNGPDSVDNVLCVCPNDHVRIDYGEIGFDSSWNVIQLATGQVISPLTIHPKHRLNQAHATYQRSLFP